MTRFIIEVNDPPKDDETTWEEYLFMFESIFFALKRGIEIKIMEFHEPTVKFPNNMIRMVFQEKLRYINDVDRQRELEEENIKSESYNNGMNPWNRF